MRRVIAPLLALTLIVPTTALLVHAEDPAPQKALSEAEITELVAQLGHDDFKIRESASRTLAKLGEKARGALEKASQESKSLEARWRAQQLLRRLSGTQAKPVDGTPPEPRGGGFGVEDDAEVQRLKRLVDEWRKKLEKDLGGMGAGRMGGNIFPMAKIKAPGLELVQGMRGVRLTVIDENATGPEARKDYEGRTLDAILAKHPELAKHPGMADLKSKYTDPMKRLRDMIHGAMRGGGPRIDFGTLVRGSGVEIRQGADGATVKITERDENGKPVVKEYKGKDLEEIKAKYPELKDKLGGMGKFEFRIGKPKILRPGDTDDWMKRFRPTTPTAKDPRAAQTTFGVWVESPDPVLAMHLGLEKDHGGLVRQVVEGSQAATMGVERGDIIVRVGQEQVVSREQLVRLLREAAKNGGALTLEVIRRGVRETLTR